MRKRFARILCGSLSVMLFCGQGMAYAGTVPAENETGKGSFLHHTTSADAQRI